MMSISPSFHLLSISILWSLISPLISSSIPISIFNTIPHSNPFRKLAHLASTSMARAHHIKNIPNAPASATPVFLYSGAYSISLGFGTPPQKTLMIFDTGSSLSWLPCTKRYVCQNCFFPSERNISSFLPKQSSSARILVCNNPKCGWLHNSFGSNTSCRDSQTCPPYNIRYGRGSTSGLAMVETLSMPAEKIPGFLVGCSIFSSDLPAGAGIAGFGRKNSSFVSQLGLKKFSYCLVSQKFDSTSKSSLLYMDSLYNSDKKTENLSYTPFLKNPAPSDYYYVGLRKITVGGRKVEVSYEQLKLDYSTGNGGTIVDSGSTLMYMRRAVYDEVANAFMERAEGYKRDENVESSTGLRPCFDVSGEKIVKMPELKFHFKGGVEMGIPWENYFVPADDGNRKSVMCLAVATDNTLLGPELDGGGPSVILGNFVMQDFHVEFDLRNERFGFKQQSCS